MSKEKRSSSKLQFSLEWKTMEVKRLDKTTPDLIPYYDAIVWIVGSSDATFNSKSAAELDECLCLGNLADARNIERLKEKNITHIINTAEGLGMYSEKGQTKSLYDDSFKYMGFDANDNFDYPIMDHFEKVHSFIEEARKNNTKCLIHCMQGVNRSGVLATAHIMVKNNIGPISAVQIVYEKRGILLTNCSFISKLLMFAKERGYLKLDENHVLVKGHK